MTERKWSTAALLLLLVAASIPMIMDQARAGEPIFRTNTLVNWEEDLRTYDQIPSDIICTSGGRIYIGFHSGLDYLPFSAYVSYSDNGGSTWSRAIRVDDVLQDGNNSNDDTSQAMVRLAEAPNGTIYAIWQDNRDFTHTQQIRIAWSEDGENFTRSVRVDPDKLYPTMNAQNPSIAINGDGRIVAAWEDRNNSGSYWNVYSSYSDDGGVTWSTMKRINTDSMHYMQHTYTRMAMRGDDVYITWMDKRGDGQYRPYLAASHDGGETFSAETDLSDDLELYNSRQWPSPALDDQGNLYVAWRDKRAGFDEIWFVRSRDGGSTFSNNMRVVTVPEGADDWFPSVAARGDGIVSVAFQRRVPTKDSKDEGEIFYINSSDGGDTWDRVMRVDDSDRKWEDFSVQARPKMVFDNQGRAIVTWADERNADRENYYADVWFSRHSGDLSGPNHQPSMYDHDFRGEFSFNREVGSPVSQFRFSINYSDEDNDRPAVGYPRLHVFNDSAGEDPLMEPVTMIKAQPRDIDYIDGSLYTINVSLPSDGGMLYYRTEVVEERNPDPVLSPVMEGPIIDSDPPRITVESPAVEEWIDHKTVRCTILVEEMEGAHVKPGSIKVRKSTTGPDHFDKGIRLTSMEMIDNNTYRAHMDLRLDDGKENYLIFEAKDRVNNLRLTDPLNIWIDSFKPYYSAIGPTDVQLYETVNCTIDWMDRYPGSTLPNSGLDISTIKYSYKTTSGPFSDWLPPDGLVELSPGAYRAWVVLEFENEGIYNRIRWKASDNIGNTRYTHDDPDHPNGGTVLNIDVRIPDNYPPEFVGKAYPSVISSSTPHFYWDDAFDEEGNELFYKVMVLKNELTWINWIPVGKRTFFDVPSESALGPDWYVLRINVTDRIGGYDLYDHRFRIIDTGTPPPEDIPQSPDMYTSDRDYVIQCEDTPSWATMNITYWIRIGSYEWGGDILDWTPVGSDNSFSIEDLNMTTGLYSVQYMAENNGNFSRVSMSSLKINDYQIAIEPPEETIECYRGEGEGIRVNLYNYARFHDNVTVEISGEIVDRGWAYLDVKSYSIESDRILTVPTPEPVIITVYPDRRASKGTYDIILTATSEDGETVSMVDNITVRISDRRKEGIGGEITDTLYSVVTDLFPFLEPLSPNLITGVFLLVVLVLVSLIATAGISLHRRSKRPKEEDPYKEQRKLYKELYGEEPTREQLEEMKEGSVMEEVMDTDIETEKGGKEEFTESFLDSERSEEESEE